MITLVKPSAPNSKPLEGDVSLAVFFLFKQMCIGSQFSAGRWFIFSSLTEKIESQPTGARREVRMTATCVYACHINVSLLIQVGGVWDFSTFSPLCLVKAIRHISPVHRILHGCALPVTLECAHTSLTAIREIWH